jgi:cell division protein FtsI (penicillin-binding protein 3)
MARGGKGSGAAARLVERRIGLLFAVFLMLLALAVLRAGYLMAFKGGQLKRLANTQQVEDVKLIAKRGTITDRHGAALAISEDASTVYATPYLVQNPVKAASRLAPLIDRPAPRLLRALSDRSKGFVYLARKIPARAGRRVQKLSIAGIGVLDDSRRWYPEKTLASQVIGAVGVDNEGLLGIEQQLDDKLHGADGEQRITRDARGQPVSLDQQADDHAGHDLELTLDASIQARTEQVLGEVGQAYRPKGATAIVMDPNNGDILAMANWPLVDANAVGDAPAWARINRAVGLTYEPGSTFKSITVAGALSEGIVRPRTVFEVGPQIKVADRTITEAHGTGGMLSVSDILARSSNVGAVKIGMRLGDKRFDSWVRRFGFGSSTELPLPGESAGIVPHWQDYSGSSIGNLPIGQGLAVTPMQMARAYSAIANGGILREPRLVLDGEPRSEGTRLISERTSAHLRTMLEGVLGPGGTAPEAVVPGYDIAGKTGTAEKPENGVYSKTKFVASFIGFAPAADPKLLVAVIVDEPQGEHAGGQVAAPAFEQIASFALPRLGIAPG